MKHLNLKIVTHVNDVGQWDSPGRIKKIAKMALKKEKLDWKTGTLMVWWGYGRCLTVQQVLSPGMWRR